ncbi:M24 family metallopeptidase [Candidatus Gracilibacteria bacterium]|nr:M24 family metallopeptidase [Candidatus Gracilibacteria bacterium]MCF7856594.1 M24 family metallopeptidase [Candidatus Gracilibacteria bacterium]MCF7896903.1 M24 family metallopeptidase [Candidatus Gracilibacteria bacterium]
MSLKKIRESCRLADEILAEVVGNLRRDKSEIAVAAEIRKLAKEKTKALAFPSIVAFGKNSAEPHHSPTERKLKVGDIVKIDLGVRIDGFCSDLTRTFFTRKPTDFQQKIYATVSAAQKLGIRKVAAGTSGKALDALVRDSLARKGFAKNFIHSLGHGLGRRIHQNPKISPKSKSSLKNGDAITIEPGLYFPGKFGVRIEDTVLVGKNRAEVLTKFPKKMKVLAI